MRMDQGIEVDMDGVLQLMIDGKITTFVEESMIKRMNSVFQSKILLKENELLSNRCSYDEQRIHKFGEVFDKKIECFVQKQNIV